VVTVARSGKAGDAGDAGDAAVLTVRDEGMGIPAADLRHVFDQYHRAANVSGRIGGAGIGLADVRQVVVGHGGTITLESHEAGAAGAERTGGWTCVTVLLPLADSANRAGSAGSAGSAGNR
jgi:signal transduction histidine kinase